MAFLYQRSSIIIGGAPCTPPGGVHSAASVYVRTAITLPRVPELPDVVVYIEALTPRVVGQPLERLRIGNPFVIRTIEPPASEFVDRRVTALRRMGKRIVFAFDGDLFLVLHLMIAGRFRWRDHGAAIPGKIGLAAFDFPTGTLLFTE